MCDSSWVHKDNRDSFLVQGHSTGHKRQLKMTISELLFFHDAYASLPATLTFLLHLSIKKMNLLNICTHVN